MTDLGAALALDAAARSAAGPQGLPPGIERLSRFQTEVAGILDDLLRSHPGDVGPAIAGAIARLGAACGADRIYVARECAGGGLETTHDWTAGDIPAPDDPATGHCATGHPATGHPATGHSATGHPAMPPPALPAAWRERLESATPLYLHEMPDLPSDVPDHPLLRQQGIHSLLVVPLLEAGRRTGFLACEAGQAVRPLLSGEIGLIGSVANVIGSLLHRAEREQAITRAQQELAEERNRLQATLDAMPDLVLELDADGRFVNWHAGWLTSDGIRPEDYLGRQVEEVLPPEVAAVTRRIMAEVDSRGVSAGQEYQIHMAHGLRWHSISAARLAPRMAGGRPGYLAVLRDTTETHAQRRQAQRLGLFAQRTTNLVIVTDARQRIDWMNAAAETQTGYSLHEALGRPLCAVLHCDASDSCSTQRLRSMLAAGEGGRAELLARSRDGRPYWLDLSMQPLGEADGTGGGFMAVATDITAHKRQEAQLAASANEAQAARRQLAAAVDVLPDAFAYYDADDRLVVCNEQYYQYYPRSAGAIVPGASFEEILRHGLAHGEYLEAVGREDAWLAARLQAHRQDWNEQEQQMADGRWLRVLERSTPDGGRVGLRVDVTALKLAEQRARADLTTAMDASRDGIAITDPEGRYVYMNLAHREMFGIAGPAEIIGHSWTELYTPEVADWLLHNAIPVLMAEGGWQGEVMGRRFDGGELPQEVSLTLKDDGGIICISRDITKRLREQQEQTRLRDELHMAQRREVIGQLASGLAHDLNNLLAAIGGSATLMREAEGAEAEAHVQRILTATEQAGALVRRFLSLGRRQSNRSRIDLRGPLREAVDLVRSSLRNQTRITLALPHVPVEIEADPTDILQVVLNLVINARDAIAGAPARPEGYEIAIALSPATPQQIAESFAEGAAAPDKSYVCMTVSDNGPGIDAETQAKVFQPYFSTKGAAGTGLGLAIVSGVLTANHGAIALDSSPGVGTRFSVLWPTEAQLTGGATAPVSVQPTAQRPLAGQLAGRLVLVADDNADVLRVLTAFLEQAGAEVVPCADPRDALDAVREDPAIWDLLVTDYDMPHLTGSDLAHAAHLFAPDLPVLLITALPDWRGRVGRANPRFAGVLGKPITRADFVAAAEAAISATG